MFRCVRDPEHVFIAPGSRLPISGREPTDQRIPCCPVCGSEFEEVEVCQWCGEVIDVEGNCPTGCQAK
jgi:hypothetical protein